MAKYKQILIITVLFINSMLIAKPVESNKNPVISMGLSALVPGLGQIYNGDWDRGLLYLGIEMISFVGKNKYNKDAEDFVREYEVYGNEHWSIEGWLENWYLFNSEEHPFYNIFYHDIGELSPHDYWGPYDYAHSPKFNYNGLKYDPSSKKKQ